jgi:ataxin-10
MTLLKLLDAYQQARPATPGPHVGALADALGRVFEGLSAHAQSAIRRATGASHGPAPPALDLQLPASCAALVLASQCLVGFLLTDASAGSRVCKDALFGAAPGIIASIPGTPLACPRLLVPDGSVPPRAETLRLLDIFLPRITFGKATPSPAAAAAGGIGNPAAADAKGFAYVKRDLVRLLGTLVHDDRAAQDATRAAGGIPAVLNLCVIDERNPCQCHPFARFLRVPSLPSARPAPASPERTCLHSPNSTC